MKKQIRKQIHGIPTGPSEVIRKLQTRKLRTKTTFDPKILSILPLKSNNQFILFLRKTLLEPRIGQNLT
jgi:hypothetical protein